MPEDRKFYQHLDYLNSWKPELDKKSYNKDVTKELRNSLNRNRSLKVLDCGTGTGMGLIRLIDEGILTRAEITAFDIDPALVQDIPRRFTEYANEKKLAYKANYLAPDKFKLDLTNKNGINISVKGFSANLYTLTKEDTYHEKFDVITGQAFIEHVNHSLAYPLIKSMLKKNGLMYFSMNCDGWFNYSIPQADPVLDEKMIGLFNDLALNNQEFERVLGGEAFCGRNLPFRFQENNIAILAYGASDWVITPFKQSKNELNFIKYTLDYIFSRCHNSDPEADKLRQLHDLDKDSIGRWYFDKLKAIQEGSIGFTCAQKDILGKKVITNGPKPKYQKQTKR